MAALGAILIAGPTASGKSAWAVRLAARHNGVVINADSMQVYADLRILTARPSDSDLMLAPHVLYGHVPGAAAYSVGRWLDDVGGVIATCRKSGKLPIVVGGTGLYFKALLEGISPIPTIPPEVRAFWRTEAGRVGAERLHELLSQRDPATAARLRRTDPQRLTRALEVLDATGRGLTHWQGLPGTPVIDEREAVRLLACLDREVLWRRAQARFDAMMAAGALEEVRELSARGFAPELPVMRALGVPPLIAAIESRMALPVAVERAKLDTRQYIKRQETWFRRNMMSWKAVSAKFMESKLLEDFTFKNC